ncbi:hypothetical protein QR680_002067 [Steinernema hermaphroditum]|uniref:Uncharacterized protein n=1 Tax=Steinernema hermaphroditum TaxID=289476 RepID=A0AA39H148_9BILA|nr:hypothetical protein QR680_002067 [Steinernema hermaphroditum]
MSKNMALIYASAVNKRMNSHSVHGSRSRKKSSSVNAPDFSQMSTSYYHLRQRSNEEKGQASCEAIEVYRSLSSTREKTPQRKRSTSQQSTNTCQSDSPQHKMSLDHGTYRHHGVDGLRSSKSHKPIQRSRTSCGDLVQKNGKSSRKISTPMMTMTQSMTFDERQQLSKNNLRRSLAHRRMVQEYGLENEEAKAHPKSNLLDATDGEVGMSRRKSISLDADDWKNQIDAAVEAQTGVRLENCKPSAFQRMRNKFAKLKLTKSGDVR